MSTAGRGRVVDALNRKTVEILNAVVESKELSHPELSAKAGIPRSTLSKLLAGTSAMDLGQLQLICHTLGLEPWKILQQAEEAIAAEQSTNLVRFPTLDSTPTFKPEPEFTPEIAQRSAAKTPHHPLDGYTTEHGLNYDDLGEENQDPQDREQ